MRDNVYGTIDEDAVLEVAAALRQFLADLPEALLFLLGKIDTGEAEIAEGVLENLSLFRRERFSAGIHLAIGFEKPGVMSALRVEIRQFSQAARVRVPQLLAVHHAVEMCDGIPRSVEALLGTDPAIAGRVVRSAIPMCACRCWREAPGSVHGRPRGLHRWPAPRDRRGCARRGGAPWAREGGSARQGKSAWNGVCPGLR